MSERTCTKCGVSYPDSPEYFYSRKLKDGTYKYWFVCVECEKIRSIEYEKKRYWTNREHFINKAKKWNRNNPDKHNENERAYYLRNRERLAKEKSEYRAINPEKTKEIARRWNKNHPGASTLNNARRRNIKKKLKADLTQNQWIAIQFQFNIACAYCGKDAPLTQDHLTPLVRNGELTASNIVPACKRCNSSKNKIPFRIWYPAQPFYDPEREARIREWIGST